MSHGEKLRLFKIYKKTLNAKSTTKLTRDAHKTTPIIGAKFFKLIKMQFQIPSSKQLTNANHT